MAASIQRTLDDLGTPLADVTFCVIDLETTGGSAEHCGITEIGAIKVRGGENLGTFQTMVNPGRAIPPSITVLTGITQSMVVQAPRIEAVLPSLLEFCEGTVLVGHNVRFDLSFLDAALVRDDRPRLANRSVDTCALARRLLRDEVPNCKLGTLADRLRLDHKPSHRALDDALATADLLHALLERVGSMGITGLDDLLALPKLAGHPQVAKLKLTDRLPRAPGVYLFRDGGNRVLYVGKATDLRSRVRSYFTGDERRKVGQLLRETQRIDHAVCASPLEAAVVEARLLHQLRPRFNRHGTRPESYAYLKLTHERFPRLVVARSVKDDGALYLGPLPSSRVAKLVAEAVETVIPLRRCTGRAGPNRRSGPCVPAQLGVALCPCAGAVDELAYRHHVERASRGLTADPELLLAPLGERLAGLAAAQRFEEAAATRDRVAALSRTIRRQGRLDALRRSGRLVVEVPGHGGAELLGGRLVRAWADDRPPTDRPPDLGLAGLGLEGLVQQAEPAMGGAVGPTPRDLADELGVVLAWLERHAGRLRLLHCDDGLAWPFPDLPDFQPRGEPRGSRRV